MPGMTDPSDALLAFQRQLLAGALPLQPCTVPDLFVLAHQPSGKARFSYLAIEGRTLKALVMLAHNGHEGALPCFQIATLSLSDTGGKALPGAYCLKPSWSCSRGSPGPVIRSSL